MNSAQPRDERSRAVEALRRLDPSLGRDDWFRAAVAFKAAVPDGFDDFNQWSAGGANYKGASDVFSMWRSIKPDRGVGVGTLFAMANFASTGHYRARRPLLLPAPTAATASPRPDPAELWDKCLPAPADHPYIVRKRGRPEGLRVVPEDAPGTLQGHRGSLVVPVRNEAGRLQSLTFIPAHGQKRNLWGCSMDGWFTVGTVTPGAAIYVVEGIGQAWTVKAATGKPAVVTFGFGRTRGIVDRLRVLHPESSVTLVPDAGKEEEANQIAAAAGCSVAAMPPGRDRNFDVNDLAAEEGIEAVREVLARAQMPAPRRRFRLLTSDELPEVAQQDYRIRSVLPAVGLAAIYGASGSGKSFLSLDMAVAIAGGSEWFGRKVKPAPVAYVALEGQDGFRQRVRAIERERRARLPATFRLCTVPFKLTSGDDVHDLAEAVRDLGAAPVVLIDTLNRAAPGADENSSRDMGTIIEQAMALRELTGGLVILIHHTGKDVSKGLRGHSSLAAALDVTIEVSRSGEARSWRLAKNKDGADDVGADFGLRVVEVGLDAGGDPVDSCVVVADSSADALRDAKLPAGAQQKIAYTALKAAIAQAGGHLPVEAAITCVSAAIKAAPGRGTTRAKEVIQSLADRRLLVLQEEVIRVA